MGGAQFLVVAVQLKLSLLGAGAGPDTVDTNAGTTPDASSLGIGIGAGAWWFIDSVTALGYAAAVGGSLAVQRCVDGASPGTSLATRPASLRRAVPLSTRILTCPSSVGSS